MRISFRPKYVILVMLFGLLAAYALYQARFLIMGPRVWINSPTNGETVSGHLIITEGWARNIAWLRLNDRQIFTDEDGRWSEKLLVSEGLSIITIKASDRFGRETTKSVQIFLHTPESLN